MAYRLGDYVVYGELRNRGYSTFGDIALCGEEGDEQTQFRFELTGSCARDLQGKTIRFMPKDESEVQVFNPREHKGFQIQQIGPTGTMTAQDWVKTLPCPVEEFLQRSKLGEPPPVVWKRRLYLEWYSQNGRVVIEMVDPIIEECLRQPDGQDDEGEWAPLPNLALPPEEFDGRPTAGPSITMVHLDGETAHIRHIAPETHADESDDQTDTIPQSLQRQLDTEAAEIDRAIGADAGESEDDFTREMELMDDCIENGDGTPIPTILGDISRLPRPEDLDDAAVEAQLKGLLAHLAMLSVAIDICKHFTPRDVYTVLLEKVLPESAIHERMIGTGWVQHIETYHYCPKCEAEFNAEYEEYEKEQAKKPKQPRPPLEGIEDIGDAPF